MTPQEQLIPRQTTQTIGTSAVDVADNTNGSQRIVILITNTSAGGQVISLGVGVDAVAGSGIVIGPGFSWQESIDNKFTPTNERISAISSAAGATIAIHERVEL